MALCDGYAIQEKDLDLTQPVPVAPSPTLEGPPPSDLGALESYKEALEKQTILRALEQTRWNRTAAAKQLGITFRALRYRLKKLGLE